MTNTKWLSALLAGTALSVAGTAAMADTSFLTLTRNGAGEGVTLRVSPTADMPGAATEVTVTGQVRATLARKSTEGDAVTDLGSRLRIYINGKTQTSVGEIGVNSRLQSYGGNVDASSYEGYWKATDSVTLAAGHGDSTASIGYGPDWNATGGVWNYKAAGLTNPSVDYARLTFANGPVTAAIALESNTVGDNAAYGSSTSAGRYTHFLANYGGGNKPSVAGSLSFDAGMVKAQVVGRAQSGWSSTSTGMRRSYDGKGISAHMVGAGLGFTADMFTVEVAAATGRGMAYDYTYLSRPNLATASSFGEAGFEAASILASVAVSEDIRIEAFGGMAKVDENDFTYGGTDKVQNKLSGFGAGVFYTPVKQLTLGLGASSMQTTKEETDGTKHDTDSSTVGVGAWFKF